MAASWRQEVRLLDRDVFVERHPHPFLLLLDDFTESNLRKYLSIMTQDSVEDPEAGLPGSVIPLVKSTDNPYQGKIIVGRARNCDVVLRHASVSKFHAELRVRARGAAEFSDKGSRNGCMIEDEIVEANTPHPLVSGTRIQIGAIFAVFLGPSELYDALA